MLILSRKANESIIIGDNIRITVSSIRGRYVRLGIEAPGDVGIYREEILLDQATEPSPPARDIRQRVQASHDRRTVDRDGGCEDEGPMALNERHLTTIGRV